MSDRKKTRRRKKNNVVPLKNNVVPLKSDLQVTSNDNPVDARQAEINRINDHAKEVLKLRLRLNQILSKHTGKSVEQVEKDSDRDYFMDADTATDYGLIDTVLLERENDSKA